MRWVEEPDWPAAFNALGLHPTIVHASRSLFADGHYPSSIFEAFKAVNVRVKERVGDKDLDGINLMEVAFSEQQPILALNRRKTRSDRDEQKGFKFLFMGAMLGIRNPKAHDLLPPLDPARALWYLAFASLLATRTDECTVGTPLPPA